jgi:uncharacterized protein with von Willebrand factor type A (vWA) domain
MNEVDQSLGLFLGFCRQLREAGLPVGPDRTESYLRALVAIDLKSMRRVYWAGRIILTSRREHVEIYDQVFDFYFLGRGNDSLPSRIDVAKTDNAPSTDQEAKHHQAQQAVRVQAGKSASPLEHYREKTLRSVDRSEQDQVDRLAAAFAQWRLDRRSRRRRSHGTENPVAFRKMLAEYRRNYGECFHIIRTARKIRPRRLVFLLDVSRSMSAQSRTNLLCAYAACQGHRLTEVFSLGTQLTRITSHLMLNDLATSLTRTARHVLDWDGGTRLADAFAQLLESDRLSRLLRGSILVLFSDGLEKKGGSVSLGMMMARVSRLVHRVIWVNPLCADPEFRPIASGIRAILPHVGAMVGYTSLNALLNLPRDLAGSVVIGKSVSIPGES